ncbi:hypothetical protein FOXYSP1_00415 [Fusarium oxysporum f. sp. phaseoli]
MQNDMMLSSSTDEQLENERKERRMDERRRVGKEEEEVSETASKAGTWSVILGAEMSCYSDKTHCSHSGLMPEGPPNTGPDNQARGVMTIHGSGDTDGARWSDTRLNHWIGGQTLAHFQTPSKVFSKRD